MKFWRPTWHYSSLLQEFLHWERELCQVASERYCLFCLALRPFLTLYHTIGIGKPTHPGCLLDERPVHSRGWAFPLCTRQGPRLSAYGMFGSQGVNPGSWGQQLLFFPRTMLIFSVCPCISALYLPTLLCAWKVLFGSMYRNTLAKDQRADGEWSPVSVPVPSPQGSVSQAEGQSSCSLVAHPTQLNSQNQEFFLPLAHLGQQVEELPSSLPPSLPLLLLGYWVHPLLVSFSSSPIL